MAVVFILGTGLSYRHERRTSPSVSDLRLIELLKRQWLLFMLSDKHRKITVVEIRGNTAAPNLVASTRVLAAVSGVSFTLPMK